MAALPPTLHDRLHSIDRDAAFVSELASLHPKLPLIANLRGGLWYAPRFDDTCYFKSTDGHVGQWMLRCEQCLTCDRLCFFTHRYPYVPATIFVFPFARLFGPDMAPDISG